MENLKKVKVELLHDEFYYTNFYHKNEIEKALKILKFYGVIKYEITEKEVLILK